MRLLVSVVLASGSLLLAGCRSPFGVDPEADTGPDAGKVGRGIHGWPLFERAPHGSGWRTDVVWPLFSGISTEGDGLNSTALLFPIFLFETEGDRRRTGILRPLYDLETQGDDVWDLDLLWPLVKWRDEPGVRERRIFPVWFEEERADNGHEHYWPFWGREWYGTHEQRWVLCPFFSHTTDTDPDSSIWEAPWPLVRWGHEGSEESVRVLPLFGHVADTENDRSEWDVLWPLVHWGHDGDETKQYALPFWWHDASPDHANTVVFPFWWSLRDEDGDFGMLFPFYGRYEGEDGDRVTSIGGPLYVGGTDDGEEFTWLLAPLVRWSSGPEEGESAAHVFPVYWHGRDADGDGYTNVWPLFGWARRGDRREASTIWPFFTYEWDDDSWELDAPWPLGRFTSREGGGSSRIWPLFSHEGRTDREGVRHTEGHVLYILSTWESEGDDESDFRILWRLVESTRHAGKDTFVVNPLFRHETNDAGDTYWSFLFGLISRKQEAGEVDWTFLWVL